MSKIRLTVCIAVLLAVGVLLLFAARRTHGEGRYSPQAGRRIPQLRRIPKKHRCICSCWAVTVPHG